MRYAEIERRLVALDGTVAGGPLSADGKAPEAWARLAQWAIVAHDVGGWDEAAARIKARGWYPENYPDEYTGNGGGAAWPYWDQTLFLQRGRQHVYATLEQAHEILWMISVLVSGLLEQDVPPAEITGWQTGAACWELITAELDKPMGERT